MSGHGFVRHIMLADMLLLLFGHGYHAGLTCARCTFHTGLTGSDPAYAAMTWQGEDRQDSGTRPAFRFGPNTIRVPSSFASRNAQLAPLPQVLLIARLRL